MPRTSSRLAKIEEENKAAEEANKRELEKLRAVLASKEKKTKKPAKTKTVSKKSRKVAAEKAGQLLTVVQMLKKKLLAPGPITLDHHKSKPTRITKKGVLNKDGSIEAKGVVYATPNSWVQHCLSDHPVPKCNPFVVLHVGGQTLAAIRDGARS